MVDAVAEHHMPPSRQVGLIRVGIGLLQGLGFWWLAWASTGTHHWPATEPALFRVLVLTTSFVPVVLLTGLGAMRTRTLVIWTLVAVAATAAFGAFDSLQETARYRATDANPSPSFPVVLATATFLFIAHRLVGAADTERKLIASYPTYFDAAWKVGVQLALALAFVGAFWAALGIGAALFNLIGLPFLGNILKQDWFHFPATTMAFAAAVHLADVRAGLTRGIRTVGLMLLSWLMPLMGVLTIGFLFALIFTGLAPLWKLGHATAVMLGAAAWLIVLINAAYQDGLEDTRAPVVLRWAARASSLALTPLLVVAAVGLWLRMGQYGLTPDRVIALACLVIGFCYAIGYGLGAVLPGAWMKLLERTNVLTAAAILVVIVALFTPIADPARLSVDDQVSRLESGRTAPDRFDYAFLRFKSGAHGRDALKRLAAKTTGPNAAAIAAKAKEAQKAESAWEVKEPVTPPPTLSVYPKGAKLPDSFTRQDWSQHHLCLDSAQLCEAYAVDMDGDGQPEVLINTGNEMELYKPDAKGVWKVVGSLPAYCKGELDALRAGKVTTAPPQWRDLVVDGQRVRLITPNGCATSG